MYYYFFKLCFKKRQKRNGKKIAGIFEEKEIKISLTLLAIEIELFLKIIAGIKKKISMLFYLS